MTESRPRLTPATGLDRLFPASWRELDDDDPVGPLWRGAQIFRLVGFVYALGFDIAINSDLERPQLTWLLFIVLTGANVLFAAGYVVGVWRRWWCVAAETALFLAAMLSTLLVAGPEWVENNQTWPTTLWASSALLSAALLGGAWTGSAAGILIGLTNFVYKGDVFLNFGKNATFLLLLVSGMAVGLAASRARVTHERLTAAVQAAVRAAERERLSRQVHDGVLQALALISRRGREIGGPTAELAELAADQELRLRRLISDGSTATPTPRSGRTDLGAALRLRASDQVSVSTPGDAVVMPTPTANEILAAVDNVLDNTRLHAGPSAQSFILLEDLDDAVVLSVRDDGCGIPAGRLDQAVAEGRMGISRSIIGRIESLDGRVALESAPGAGTEWEMTIPLPRGDSATSRRTGR
ncbi:MAG: DUF5931 domain-containing protein [Gordonia sp. (in: high G+C Gram-positive bacteria)]|uniref:MacS family sensor histidine kinase n=1 Tax=Gordonia sp. (in: high G+C Gram-positive bacteria) TaxID=84139 RepID=UPI0039E404C0